MALGVLLLAGAALYASVGQAGATAFLAAMAVVGMPAATMRPTALALNILAAGFSTWRFHRARQVAWRTLWPFAASSVPCSLAGGAIAVPDPIYRPVIGLVLLVAASLLFYGAGGRAPGQLEIRRAPVPVELAVGSVIGLLSGLTATGGGVFLSPVLILCRWATPRQAAGLSPPFISLNSIAGLIGAAALTARTLPPLFPLYAIATLAGTLVGASIGIKYLRAGWIEAVLGIVRSISGAKLLLW
jgi:uncharacterized membrane protein YfcA